MMDRKIRVTGLALLILFSALNVACGKKEVKEEASYVSAQEESPESLKLNGDKKSQNAENGQLKQTGKDQEQDKSTKKKDEIDIYTINDDTLGSEPTSVKVEENQEVTAETVVNAVVADFASHSLEIGIDSITENGDTVTVSFQYGKAPLSGVGSDVEETILNCISDSLLDNVKGCKAVIFQAEGEAYESGHFAFAADEAYAKK